MAKFARYYTFIRYADSWNSLRDIFIVVQSLNCTSNVLIRYLIFIILKKEIHQKYIKENNEMFVQLILFI